MSKIIFSTGNNKKFETGDIICKKYNIDLIQRELEIDEIQAEDLSKIITDKVEKAYSIINGPVIVSDDSWFITGLNGFPGPYNKSINQWFSAEDFLNLTKPLEDRSIYLVQMIAYKNDSLTKIFQTKSKGTILKEIKGESGPPSTKIFSMDGDKGLSISEIYDSDKPRDDRKVATIWHEFAQWFISSK